MDSIIIIIIIIDRLVARSIANQGRRFLSSFLVSFKHAAAVSAARRTSDSLQDGERRQEKCLARNPVDLSLSKSFDNDDYHFPASRLYSAGT